MAHKVRVLISVWLQAEVGGRYVQGCNNLPTVSSRQPQGQEPAPLLAAVHGRCGALGCGSAGAGGSASGQKEHQRCQDGPTERGMCARQRAHFTHRTTPLPEISSRVKTFTAVTRMFTCTAQFMIATVHESACSPIGDG